MIVTIKISDVLDWLNSRGNTLAEGATIEGVELSYSNVTFCISEEA